MSKRFRFSSILIFLIFLLQTVSLYSESRGKFEQILKWQSDKNAIEYKVEIKNLSDGKVSTHKTSSNSISVNLLSGDYEYRVYAFDFLGRQSSVSEWRKFTVLKALAPSVSVPKVVETEIDKKEKLSLPVEIKNIEEETSIELINTQTNEVVTGTLQTKESAGQVVAASAVFPNVEEGDWKLRVTNPSGLSTDSEVINIEEKKSEISKSADKTEQRMAENITLDSKKELSELDKERAEEEARLLEKEEEKKRLEEQKLEEKRLAEEAKKEAELKKQEEARLVAEEKRRQQEEKRRLQEERIAERNRKIEETRQRQKEAEERAKAAAEKMKEEDENLEKRIEAKKLQAQERAKAVAEREARAKEAEEIFKENQKQLKIEEELQEQERLEEERRLAEEKKEEDKELARKKRWEAILNRQVSDFNIQLGGGVTWNIYDKNFYSLSAWPVLPTIKFDFSYLPVKIGNNKFGFDINATATYVERSNSVISYLMNEENMCLNLTGRISLVKDKLYLGVKAGAGVSLFQINVSYPEDTTRKQTSSNSYGFICADGELSLVFMPVNVAALEIGANFTHIFIEGMPTGSLIPFVSFGVRF